MATITKTENIVKGPSRLDLMNALFQPRACAGNLDHVWFTTVGKPYKTIIESVERQNSYGDAWNIGASVEDDGRWRRVEIFFMTTRRLGHISFFD